MTYLNNVERGENEIEKKKKGGGNNLIKIRTLVPHS